MSDPEFLRWLHVRLVQVYGESTNMDFVQRLNTIAHKLESQQNLRAGFKVTPQERRLTASDNQQDTNDA